MSLLLTQVIHSSNQKIDDFKKIQGHVVVAAFKEVHVRLVEFPKNLTLS